MLLSKLVYSLSVVFVLSACASVTSTQAPTEAAKNVSATASTGPSHEGRWILITPFASLTRYACPSTPCIPFDDRFSGAYTRPIIFGESAADNQTPLGQITQLPYSARGWLSRLFVGVHRTVTLVAKINVGEFAATVPLVTIEHISNKNSGEVFNRVIYQRVENLPLFLIKNDGSNSIVSAKVIVRASNESQSDAAGSALKLIQNVANLVAPPAPVLTTLTSQSTKNLATAIDQSISQLFSTTIDEEQWLDDDIRRWGTSTRVNVVFRIPREEGDWTSTPDQEIGAWTITFANPRPSIFSDYEICDPQGGTTACASTFATAADYVKKHVTPDQVLSFHLLGNQPNLDTIQKYLMQQDWYQKDVATMASAATPSASSFCRSIRAAIVGLGLNATDADIVVVAVRDGLDLPRKVVQSMKDDHEDCAH